MMFCAIFLYSRVVVVIVANVYIYKIQEDCYENSTSLEVLSDQGSLNGW